MDEVFNVGLATKELLADDGRTRDDPNRQYGTGGKMQGKRFMISATWNAPRETFDNPASFMYAGKGSADLFLNITSNYKFVGFDILPDFGVWNIFKNPQVPQASRDTSITSTVTAVELSRACWPRDKHEAPARGCAAMFFGTCICLREQRHGPGVSIARWTMQSQRRRRDRCGSAAGGYPRWRRRCNCSH